MKSYTKYKIDRKTETESVKKKEEEKKSNTYNQDTITHTL